MTTATITEEDQGAHAAMETRRLEELAASGRPVILPTEVRQAKVLAMKEVIEAMRSIQTESDRWRLAEALFAEIPAGGGGFSDIIDAATNAHVDGGLTATTLRLYRDTASRWPSDKRVPNVSFSAHREAMVMPTIDEGAKLLEDLVKTQGGPGKVTVASVRKAIAVKQGKVSAAPTHGPVASPSTASALNDLKTGGKELIHAIASDTEGDDLDKLQAGLSKVIAHVEQLRARAARKAATAKAKATAPTDKQIAGRVAAAGQNARTRATTASKKGSQGDLRGL